MWDEILGVYYKQQEVNAVLSQYKDHKFCNDVVFEIEDINKDNLFIRISLESPKQEQLQSCKNELLKKLKKEVPWLTGVYFKGE